MQHNAFHFSFFTLTFLSRKSKNPFSLLSLCLRERETFSFFSHLSPSPVQFGNAIASVSHSEKSRLHAYTISFFSLSLYVRLSFAARVDTIYLANLSDRQTIVSLFLCLSVSVCACVTLSRFSPLHLQQRDRFSSLTAIYFSASYCSTQHTAA